MKSVLYVSRARLGLLDSEGDLSRLVAAARERNLALAVTGMLVYTGDHFAQLVEGPQDAIDAIMASIRRDPRHHSLCEYEKPIAKRSFGAWSLGYEGRASYVDRMVRVLFSTPLKGHLAEAQAELHELMLVLAYESNGAGQCL